MINRSDKLNMWAESARKSTAQNDKRGFSAYEEQNHGEQNNSSCLERYIAEDYSAYMLDYQRDNPESTLFTVSVLYRMPVETDLERLAGAFRTVCENHTMLLSVFEKIDGVWTIKYAPEKAGKVGITDIGREAFEAIKPTLVKPFKAGECVYRCTLFRTEEASYFFLNLNHAAIDGKGFRLLHHEISRAYFGETLEPDSYLKLHKVSKDTWYKCAKMCKNTWYSDTLQDYVTIPRPDRDESGLYGSLEIPWPEDLDFTPESTLRHVLKRLAGHNGAPKSLCTWTWHARDTVEKQRCIGLFIRDIPAAWDSSTDELIMFPCDTKWDLNQEQYVTYTTFQGTMHDFTGIPGIECEELGQDIWHEANADIPADNALDIEFLDDSRGKRLSVKYDAGMYDESTILNLLKP